MQGVAWHGGFRAERLGKYCFLHPREMGTATRARCGEMAPSRHCPQCDCPTSTVSPPSRAWMMHHSALSRSAMTSRAELRQQQTAEPECRREN